MRSTGLVRLAQGLTLVGQIAAIAGCALIVLLTLADVVFRALLNRPVLGASELTASALAVLVGAGFILCAGRDDHIRITLFEGTLRRLLPEAVHLGWVRAWEVASSLIMALLMARYAQHLFANFDYTPVLDFPLGRVFVAVTVLMGLAFVLLLLRLTGHVPRS